MEVLNADLGHKLQDYIMQEPEFWLKDPIICYKSGDH